MTQKGIICGRRQSSKGKAGAVGARAQAGLGNLSDERRQSEDCRRFMLPSNCKRAEGPKGRAEDGLESLSSLIQSPYSSNVVLLEI